MKYAVIFDAQDGAWGAHSPDFPGCISTGETLEECRRNFSQALEFHIEGMRADGLAIPEPHSEIEYVAA